MMGILGWPPSEVWPLTLRELVLPYEARVMDAWDHTAATSAMLHNLQCIVIGIASKARPKPRPMSYFHPYRRKKNQGLKINQSNFGLLKTLGAMIVRN